MLLFLSFFFQRFHSLMADNLPAPICVLKVNNIQCCDTCPKKLKKLLEKINGVKTVTVDAKNGLVTVSGAVDPSVLIEAIAKKRRKAELLLYEKEPNKVDLDIVSDKRKILNGERKEPCYNCCGRNDDNHGRRDGGQKRGMKSERNVVEPRVSSFRAPRPPGAEFEGSDGGHNRGHSFKQSGMKEKEFFEPRPLGGFGGVPGPEFAGWRPRLPPVVYQQPPGLRFAGPPMQPPAGYGLRPGLHQPLLQPFAYQHHPAFYPQPTPIQTRRPQHYQPLPIQQTIPPLPYPYDIYQKKNEPPQGGNPMLHLFRDDNVNSCSIS